MEDCDIQTKLDFSFYGPSGCQENIPHIITPPAFKIMNINLPHVCFICVLVLFLFHWGRNMR